MAGNDNSFERQMLDFYGHKEAIHRIVTSGSDNKITNAALFYIGMDIKIKNYGISKQDIEREKNRLQIELYSQLEIDRQNEKNI